MIAKGDTTHLSTETLAATYAEVWPGAKAVTNLMDRRLALGSAEGLLLTWNPQQKEACSSSEIMDGSVPFFLQSVLVGEPAPKTG